MSNPIPSSPLTLREEEIRTRALQKIRWAEQFEASVRQRGERAKNTADFEAAVRVVDRRKIFEVVASRALGGATALQIEAFEASKREGAEEGWVWGAEVALLERGGAYAASVEIA